MEVVIADANRERLQVGDSHLRRFQRAFAPAWQADTAHLRDHNGVVIDWDLSKMLYDSDIWIPSGDSSESGNPSRVHLPRE